MARNSVPGDVNLRTVQSWHFLFLKFIRSDLMPSYSFVGLTEKSMSSDKFLECARRIDHEWFIKPFIRTFNSCFTRMLHSIQR